MIIIMFHIKINLYGDIKIMIMSKKGWCFEVQNLRHVEKGALYFFVSLRDFKK